MIKKRKKTVNTGPVMFSGEIYYTDPLNWVDKIVGFFCAYSIALLTQ